MEAETSTFVLVHNFPTTFQTIYLEAEYVNFLFGGKQDERMWTNDPHYWSHFDSFNYLYYKWKQKLVPLF